MTQANQPVIFLSANQQSGIPLAVAMARLIVEMTDEEMFFLDSRATKAGLTPSEFVRRMVRLDDQDHNQAAVAALASALKRSGPAILRSLDDAIATASAAIAELDGVGGRR